jgi:hypothetical protein
MLALRDEEESAAAQSGVRTRIQSGSFGEVNGSASKNETTLAKTRQAILPMVSGESRASLDNPKAAGAGLQVFDTFM